MKILSRVLISGRALKRHESKDKLRWNAVNEKGSRMNLRDDAPFRL